MEPVSAFVLLGEALQKGGPWVLLAITLLVIRFLYREGKDERATHREEVKQMSVQMLAIVKEQTTVIVQNNENQKLMIKAMEGR
jgi:hypothetical protein